MWSKHNRDYAALNLGRCRDLIDSIISSGKQEMPAIVRAVDNDPDIEYEVICGARRHWSITWLRENNYPQFRFLVEVQKLSDEEAFRLADLENRSREDISDYERAVDYRHAIDLYYHGSQSEMAERLKVSNSWLSKLLYLPKLPEEVLDAFQSRTLITSWLGEQLAPLMRKDRLVVEAILGEAKDIKAENEIAGAEGRSSVDPKEVVRRLVRVGRAAEAKRGSSLEDGSSQLKSFNGKPVFQIERVRGGTVKISVLPGVALSRSELLHVQNEIVMDNPDIAKFVVDLSLPD
jgi:ParB family chromosome partitioning protein